MQSKQAEELREKWGNKPCSHPGVERVYDMGAQDGYACIQCGEWFLTKEDFRQSRQQNS